MLMLSEYIAISLNPCCNGRYFQSECADFRITEDYYLVLILVVMEDTFRDDKNPAVEYNVIDVLILVVMEDTFRV